MVKGPEGITYRLGQYNIRLLDRLFGIKTKVVGAHKKRSRRETGGRGRDRLGQEKNIVRISTF
jgi:hypothetical protein